LAPTWQISDENITEGDENLQTATSTTLMIVPGDQTPSGGTVYYLLQLAGNEFSDVVNDNNIFGLNLGGANQGDLPDPPEWVMVNGQAITDMHVTNVDGTLPGYVIVSGPAGAPLTVTLASTQYYMNKDQTFPQSDIQIYHLVSQCVAPIPVNLARTNIGVGELVNLSFNPDLPSNSTNIIWSTTAGSLSATNGVTDLFTAPDNATNVTITATVGNIPVNLYFQILAPTSYANVKIISAENDFGTGNAGAGMNIDVWIGPTNVSFYQVEIMEVGEIATNATGYFANTNTWPANRLDHSQHGANEWIPLGFDNSVGSDQAGSGPCSPPWSPGNFTWPIPADWKVGVDGSTNSMIGWSQNFTIDASGTVTVQKFGHTVTRTTNNVITIQ
jgi:hypothetical protein